MSGHNAEHNQARSAKIDKLDYVPTRTARPDDDHHDVNARQVSLSGSLFERVAAGVAEQDGRRRKKDLVRFASLIWAVITALCAGSLTTYSLYSPILQHRLEYSQFQISGVIVAAEIALYLPVPVAGYLCDRYGPARPSVFAGLFSSLGYLIAALTYRSRLIEHADWQYALLTLGFVLVGMAASTLYICAVTCCVKNFGRGRHKGLALALPISAFGLSGLCLSQFGLHVLHEPVITQSDRGRVDVFSYFIFLSIALLISGVVSGFLFRIVDEDAMIEEAAENLVRSGFLEEEETPLLADDENEHGNMHESIQDLSASVEFLSRRKSRVLSKETRLFLQDPAMWLLLVGFFLLTGPGECYMNNVGTMIGTLYPVSTPDSDIPTSPATHVSVIAIASTIARIASGSVSDAFSPSHTPSRPQGISRVLLLIISAIVMVAGQIMFAAGFAQNHAERFWVISALLGIGYGAAFSLTPMIISIVWGVENFGTNWGIVAVAPAFGATLWGAVYSTVYQHETPNDQRACHGKSCYAGTFWGMAVSTILACVVLTLAWRGPRGWHKRDIRL